MEEVQAPTEHNLFGEEAVRLGRDWPTEHDDTSHMKRGYYRRDNGSLGKVVGGIKLSESEDDHSSSHSEKRHKIEHCTSESDQSESGYPNQNGNEENGGSITDNEDANEVDANEEDANEEDANGDAEEDSESFSFTGVCLQRISIDEDGNTEECGNETDGCSQLCHDCKQAMKRGWFADFGKRRTMPRFSYD